MKTFILFAGLLLASSLAFGQQSLEDVNYDENGRFAVQVEAWQSDVKAEQRVNFWKDQGFEYASFAQDGNEDTGDIWFRVFLGRFSNMEDARQFQDVFAEMFDNETWITTTTSGSEPVTRL